MTLKAAFLFVAPEADPEIHRTKVTTPAVELTVVGAPGYAEAERVARQLVEEGVGAIELCGGFGNEGVARIAKAVGGKAAVGAVRFDFHPRLDWKSGDAIFG